MRHRKAGRRLGRTTSHRLAMVRNMVTSVFEHERIVTTTPKAKEVRRVVDKMITLAKRGDLHAKRQAFSFIQSRDVVAKLFDEIAGQYSDRNGRLYPGIYSDWSTRGDAAPMAILELVNYSEKFRRRKRKLRILFILVPPTADMI